MASVRISMRIMLVGLTFSIKLNKITVIVFMMDIDGDM